MTEIVSIHKADTRPEEIRFFLTYFRYKGESHLLCQHKHESFQSAADCLREQGNYQPEEVRILEVIERLIYEADKIYRYNLDGQQISVDYDGYGAGYDIRSRYTDASGLTVEGIKKNIRDAATKRRAEWRARRAARMAEKRGGECRR
jgi:hypothetical protein